MNGVTADVVVVVGGEVVVGRAGCIGLVSAVAVVLQASAVNAAGGDGHCDVILSPLQSSLLVMVAAM